MSFLYVTLWLFTHAYLFAIIVLFAFSEVPFWVALLDTLAEPYLGAVAVYVVIKEIRKSRLGIAGGKRRGELFIVWWLGLLAVASALVLGGVREFSPLYRLIVVNALTVTLIYIGSRIHRP